MGLFKFKQFSLNDSRSSHKIGTDAVLLGAWADCSQADNILDIGTGCGIIALMLAQRCEAQIVGIDMDDDTVIQAGENFLNSPWRERITAVQMSLQDYNISFTQRMQRGVQRSQRSSTTDTDKKLFGLIVSNPPYFSDSLKPSAKGRAQARHDDGLGKKELLEAVSLLLADEGRFALVCPAEQEAEYIRLAGQSKLCLKRILRVRTKAEMPVVRVLMDFAHTEIERGSERARERGSEGVGERVIIEELVLRDGDGEYSEAYRELTRDFHPMF